MVYVCLRKLFSAGAGRSVLYMSVRLHRSVGLSGVLFPCGSWVWLSCL